MANEPIITVVGNAVADPELRFTPTQTGDNQTLFGAGGNLFLRYESNKLVFGASTKSGNNWTDHKIESAAATGAEHVVSVAYVPNEAGTGAKLVMRVDGGRMLAG